MTVLDLMTARLSCWQTPRTSSRTYQEQGPEIRFHAVSGEDQPAIHRNDELMERMRPKMVPFYYDARKYKTYLDQLGVKYPGTVTQ